MKFSELRERTSVIKVSKIILILFGLMFLLEHVKCATRIARHIHANHYNPLRAVALQADRTTEVEDRLRQIKEMKLKPGIVGYIGDSALNKGDMHIHDFYVARYALAPLVLDFYVEHDTVVCDFPFSRSIKNPMNPLTNDDRWTILSDNGEGAFLIVKKRNF
jgi:hypothetical protein